MMAYSVNDGTKRHHVAFAACQSALDLKEFTSNVKSAATSAAYCDSVKFIVEVFLDILFTIVRFILLNLLAEPVNNELEPGQRYHPTTQMLLRMGRPPTQHGTLFFPAFY